MPAGEPRRGASVLTSTGPAGGLFAATQQCDKSLRNLCDRGTAAFRPFGNLMADIFEFFYDPKASVVEGGCCDKLHFLVMKYLASEPAYAALRALSAGKFEESLAAAQEFGTRLLDSLEDSGRPASGAKTVASRPLPDLHIEIDRIVLAEVARAGAGGKPASGVLVLAKRVEGAIETAGVLADVCHIFGISPGDIRGMAWEQRSALSVKMGNSSNLRRLADLVGRWSALATSRSSKKTPGLPEEFSDVTLGDDWHVFVPHELGFLVHPALRYDFFLRVIDRRVVQYDPQSAEKSGRGPVVVCVDTSGSMAGSRDISAKAASLALHSMARRTDRPFAEILFSSPGEVMSFLFRHESVVARDGAGEEKRLGLLEGIMSAATFFFGGGTDYESPLRTAVALIENGGHEWRDADIVFLTDDYCEVEDSFAAQFRQRKENLQFKVFSIMVGASAEDARVLWKFSDRVVSVNDFDDNAAEQVFDAI